MSVTRKTLMVSGVAVATLGLSTCKDGGAVDPAPPPLDCTVVGKGDTLSASGALIGQNLRVTITNQSDGSWQAIPTVSNVVGGTLVDVINDPANTGAIIVEITLDSDTTVTGAFTLNGTLTGFEGETCAVTRTFTFSIGDGGVTVALDDRLPLGSKERASIVVMRREGREVELHAAGAKTGAVGWTATGGAVDARAHDKVTWRLPEEPGLYQIELLVDRGREGLSVDTLTLEVT
jgi:hypothetical protein